MSEITPGNLFIVAAPSGGGKTSLVKQVIAAMPDIDVSVSHTTREQRSGEQHGEHYFFIKPDEFEQMIRAGEFIEHARVFEHHYGTSAEQIHQRLLDGIDIILDIDWQGAQQIKKQFPQAVSVFIIPPSLEALELRLTGRKRDNKSVIQQRMAKAIDEMSHYNEFDFLIVNDDFNEAAQALQAIVTAERLKMARQRIRQKKLLSFLLSAE